MNPHCRWRWTLIQLIAPSHVRVYFIEVQNGVGGRHFHWYINGKFISTLWARDTAIKAHWHAIKPRHGTRLVSGEGTVVFRVGWIFPLPLILTPLNHFFLLSCLVANRPLPSLLHHRSFWLSDGRRASRPPACTQNFPGELQVRLGPSFFLHNKS